ncbi:MAG: hydroxymethylbilane synthase [Porphyromonadaceae bacterium]|nr:hydroxymethylbilane synthase [Porphyromonadaceae bacterium]
MKKIVIGTRGSRLALYQAELVRSSLREVAPEQEVEVRIIKTKGDKFLQLALDASGDKGLFTRELEQELLSGGIDLAVHSLKDLPVELVSGTSIGAILPREATADALLGAYTLETLPQGAIVGTSSRRRVEQLRLHRPDLQFRPIRGNVETRIAKMKSGQYDAIVMAVAGLRRLGLEGEISQVIDERVVVPAPGQAAIAVHQRADRTDLTELLQLIHCSRTAREVTLERNILSRLGGGCALPLGAVCHIDGAKHHVRTFYASADGSQHLKQTLSFDEGEADQQLERVIQELKQLNAPYHG